MHGYTKGELASQLSVSLRTVETHRGPFDAKTGSPDARAELVDYAIEACLSISFDPLPPLTRRQAPVRRGPGGKPRRAHHR